MRDRIRILAAFLVGLAILLLAAECPVDARPVCRGKGQQACVTRTPKPTTIPLPTPTPAPPSGDTCADPTVDVEEQRFLVMFNERRAANGVGLVVEDARLSASAQWKADRVAEDPIANYNHEEGWAQRVLSCGYPCCPGIGDFGAIVNCDAESAIAVWENSTSGHAAMFSDPVWRVGGVGRAPMLPETGVGGCAWWLELVY